MKSAGQFHIQDKCAIITHSNSVILFKYTSDYGEAHVYLNQEN